MRILLLAMLCLAGCTMPPKTASEFRNISRQRKGQHFMTVNAPLETVVSRINAHSQRCNSFGWTITRREGMGGNPANSQYSDRLLTRWEKSNTDRPSFILTIEGRQDLNSQPGGYYAFIIDLTRAGSQTKVVMYDYNFSWGYYDWATEYKAALVGAKGPCQYEEAK